MKLLLREVTPPLLWRGLRSLRHSLRGGETSLSEYEFVSYDWSSAEEQIKPRGWDVEGVVRYYEQGWSEFLKRIGGDEEICFTPETLQNSSVAWYARNVIHVFGYILARATRGREQVKFLDWGGGFGHYYYIAKRLLPELNISYVVKDLPRLISAARSLSPEIAFIDDDEALPSNCDFVFCSGALQYVADWRGVLERLMRASSHALFISRLPTTRTGRSFVMVQRPAGYGTEYLGWVIASRELIEFAEQRGFSLRADLSVEPIPMIQKAPEQALNRGFYFERRG